jgi:site-specific recombinase XerD
MPIDSLAKLLGHTNLQTTQLYIDGADPTVRADFLQAMQQVARWLSHLG